MAEKIAMTPPDRDGHQLFWTKTETDGGTLFLPEESDEAAIKILLPENYRAEVGKDGTCIGVGALPQGPGIGHHEAGYVHSLDGFAVKTAPFKTQERMLDWLAANLMMHHAILSLSEEGQDYIEERPLYDICYKIKTPKYFGALSLEETSGKSIIVMSNESGKDGRAPTVQQFSVIGEWLYRSAERAMDTLYPGNSIFWDDERRNWIHLESGSVFVRIDLFGTDHNASVFRPTVRF